MNFTQKVSAGVKKHIASLKTAYDKHVKAAEERAKTRIANARNKMERELAKLQLKREKMALKQEYYEAVTATNKAKVALNRARKESGDIGVGAKFGQLIARTGKVAAKSYVQLGRHQRKAARKTAKKLF